MLTTCIVEDSTSCALPPSPGSALTSVLMFCWSPTLTWLEAEPGEMAGERCGLWASPGTTSVLVDGKPSPESSGEEVWLETLFWKSPPSRLPPPWGSWFMTFQEICKANRRARTRVGAKTTGDSVGTLFVVRVVIVSHEIAVLYTHPIVI